MSKMSRSVLLGHSALRGGVAGVVLLVSAGSALAQGEDIETVTVTGTAIPGAAPVGANVITIDRAAIQATGATSIQSLLTTVPSITGFGNAGQGAYGSADASGTNAPTIHSLGASASNSTLILVDSHRIPLSGINHTLADPSTIPAIALQRVEVLPDGASSIYGSDAVAGVLNFITRRNFEGAETELDLGSASGYRAISFGQIIGASWSRGSVMAAYDYVGRSQLAGTARSFVNDNQSFRGLSNLGNFACAPATVSPASGTGAGLIFAYPYSGAGITNAAVNAICGQTPNIALLPAENRHAALVSLRWDATDWLTLSSDLNWSNRIDNAAISRGVITATAFGPGSGAGAQINPFYVAAPGNTSGIETVRYDFNGLFGAGAHTKSGTQVQSGTFDAEARLGGGWTLSLNALAGSSTSNTRSLGTVCAACAYLAINGTTNSAGSLTTSSNPAVLTTTTITSRPLSATNALNVWAAGAPGTQTAVLNQLLDNDNFSQTGQTINDVNLSLSGSLVTLPAGDVKTVVGADYRSQSLSQYGIANGAGGPSISNSALFTDSFGRTVQAVYAEVLLPLVGPEADMPLMRSLSLDVSGRYDHYSDVGGTSNPRLALTWEIADGLKARGSFGTSFVAPSLFSTGGALGITTDSAVTYGAGSGGPVTLPAGYANNGGGNSTEVANFCATGCTIGNATNRGITMSGPGGNSLKPETGRSYSAGADLDAGKFVSALDGFTLSVTYWQTKYAGAITSPAMTLDAQLPGLTKNLILNPTNAQIAAAYDGTRFVAAVPSGPVTFLQYFVQQNAFNLYADGIDFSAHYAFALDGMGDFRLGIDGSEKLRFDQQGGGYGGVIVSNLNRNNNQTFSSLALTGRGSVGWRLDPLSADLFLNYTNPYYQAATTTKAPANVTVDLMVGYALPSADPYLAGTQVYVSAQNLFNQPPPAYNVAAGYDVADASPLGRLVSLGLRKRW